MKKSDDAIAKLRERVDVLEKRSDDAIAARREVQFKNAMSQPAVSWFRENEEWHKKHAQSTKMVIGLSLGVMITLLFVAVFGVFCS